MSDELNRRDFFRKSLVASAAAASSISLEEKTLLAKDQSAGEKVRREAVDGLPTGKIRDVTVSRIICGGNLIGGYAHSRDLTYVSPLLKHYFTDEKIIETLEICEECGINTIIAGSSSMPVIQKYWNERGGKIQWFAQVVPGEDDLYGDAKKSIDGGAAGAFVIGNMGDQLTRAGRVDLVGKVVDFIRKQGVITGCGGHNIETPMACEKAGVDVDFYMKTSHSTNYWSKRTPDETKDVIDNYAIDNYWDKEPPRTVEFMKNVKKPWIAYKVLAAGAIHPRDGFKYAFGNGADFCCVGMFDFQVREDVVIARDTLKGDLRRQRPWRS